MKEEIRRIIIIIITFLQNISIPQSINCLIFFLTQVTSLFIITFKKRNWYLDANWKKEKQDYYYYYWMCFFFKVQLIFFFFFLIFVKDRNKLNCNARIVLLLEKKLTNAMQNCSKEEDRVRLERKTRRI